MRKPSGYGIFIITILFILLLGGCEKEDYTLPSKFKLSFSVNSEEILDGSIIIDEIGLGLNTIDIRGYREQGDDVFLTRKFDQGKNFIVKPGIIDVNENFDIPQGTYNPISFSFIFQPDPEEGVLIEDLQECIKDFEEDDDLLSFQEEFGDVIEDYLEEISPCILVKGRFTYNNKLRYIVIVVNDPLTFQIIGKNKNDGIEITLDKDITNKGNLEINPSYWFSVITPDLLNDAFYGLVEEDEYIFLSKYVNGQIYNAIVNRIEESTIFKINE